MDQEEQEYELNGEYGFIEQNMMSYEHFARIVKTFVAFMHIT